MSLRFGDVGAATAAVFLHHESIELRKLRDACGTVTDTNGDHFERGQFPAVTSTFARLGARGPSSMAADNESASSSSSGSPSASSVSAYDSREAMFHLSPEDVALFASGYERENHASFLERTYAASDLNNRLRLARFRPLRLPMMANSYWTRMCQSKLRVAAAINSMETVEHLLQKGLSPNFQDEKGRSPLHLAAARGFGDMVELLLRYGADPNVEDCRGNIPLHLAACNSSVQSVNALCAAGSDVLHRGKDGTTPIELSLSRLQAVRKSATVSEDRKVAYEQSFHILRSGLRHFSTIPRPLEKVKSNLEAVLVMVKSDEGDGFESQLDSLLSSLSSLSVQNGSDTKDDASGGGDLTMSSLD